MRFDIPICRLRLSCGIWCPREHSWYSTCMRSRTTTCWHVATSTRLSYLRYLASLDQNIDLRAGLMLIEMIRWAGTLSEHPGPSVIAIIYRI